MSETLNDHFIVFIHTPKHRYNSQRYVAPNYGLTCFIAHWIWDYNWHYYHHVHITVTIYDISVWYQSFSAHDFNMHTLLTLMTAMYGIKGFNCALSPSSTAVHGFYGLVAFILHCWWFYMNVLTLISMTKMSNLNGLLVKIIHLFTALTVMMITCSENHTHSALNLNQTLCCFLIFFFTKVMYTIAVFLKVMCLAQSCKWIS